MDDGQIHYKFNEDRDIYTELAAPSFSEIDDGFLIVFAGERDSLDNTKTGQVLNTARNVGMIKTDKEGNPMETDTSVSEEGGEWYNCGTEFNTFTNPAVMWLTDFETSEDNATRLKNIKVGDFGILILFEVWSSIEYKYTAYIRVDENGNAEHELTKICDLRLSRTSEVFHIEGTNQVHVTSG